MPSTPHPITAMVESQDPLFETAKDAAGSMQTKKERRDVRVLCIFDDVDVRCESSEE